MIWKFMGQRSDDHNRWANIARALLLIIIVAMSALLCFDGPNYYSPRHFKAVWNAGHIIYFALLPISILPYIKGWPTRLTSQAMLILAIAVMLGLIIEYAQPKFQRTADMQDLFRDMIGAAVCICFLLPDRKKLIKPLRRALQALTLGLVVLQIYPIALALADEYTARRQFPLLSGFETPFEIQRWKSNTAISIENDIFPAGRRALRVQFDTGMYSGVSLFYFHRNWKGYRLLQFSLYNPSNEPIAITCRIHDLEHARSMQLFTDRFNRTYTFNQGWHRIVIGLDEVASAPANRRMDMGRIGSVGIFAPRLPQPRAIYIDDVKLVR